MRVLAQSTIRKAAYQALKEFGRATATQLIPRVEELTQRKGLKYQNIAPSLRQLEISGRVETTCVKRRGKVYKAK